jgi:hypothetical protein
MEADMIPIIFSLYAVGVISIRAVRLLTIGIGHTVAKKFATLQTFPTA